MKTVAIAHCFVDMDITNLIVEEELVIHEKEVIDAPYVFSMEDSTIHELVAQSHKLAGASDTVVFARNCKIKNLTLDGARQIYIGPGVEIENLYINRARLVEVVGVVNRIEFVGDHSASEMTVIQVIEYDEASQWLQLREIEGVRVEEGIIAGEINKMIISEGQSCRLEVGVNAAIHSLVVNGIVDCNIEGAVGQVEVGTAGTGTFNLNKGSIASMVNDGNNVSVVGSGKIDYLMNKGENMQSSIEPKVVDAESTPPAELTLIIGEANLRAELAKTTVTILALGADIGLDAQLTIDRPVIIKGNGHRMFAQRDFGEINGSKHLVSIQNQQSANLGSVSLENIILDGNNYCFGVSTYNDAYGVLSNVEIINSKGAGLTVNGSEIVAHQLSVSNCLWGCVNVDPGSGVTLPSTFILTSGLLQPILDEVTQGPTTPQIWSDGANVTNTATVTVEATGYEELRDGDSSIVIWTNIPTKGPFIYIDREDGRYYYQNIEAAVAAATEGEIIDLMEGVYTLAGDLVINRGIGLVGAGMGLTVIRGKLILQKGTINQLTLTNESNQALLLIGNTEEAQIRMTGVEILFPVFTADDEIAQGARKTLAYVEAGNNSEIIIKHCRFVNEGNNNGWEDASEWSYGLYMNAQGASGKIVFESNIVKGAYRTMLPNVNGTVAILRNQFINTVASVVDGPTNGAMGSSMCITTDKKDVNQIIIKENIFDHSGMLYFQVLADISKNQLYYDQHGNSIQFVKGTEQPAYVGDALDLTNNTFKLGANALEIYAPQNKVVLPEGVAFAAQKYNGSEWVNWQ